MNTPRELLIGTTAALAIGAALLATPPAARAGVSVGIGIGLPFPGVVFGARLRSPVVVGPQLHCAPPRPVGYGRPACHGAAYRGPVCGRHPGKHWRQHHRHHRRHRG